MLGLIQKLFGFMQSEGEVLSRYLADFLAHPQRLEGQFRLCAAGDDEHRLARRIEDEAFKQIVYFRIIDDVIVIYKHGMPKIQSIQLLGGIHDKLIKNGFGRRAEALGINLKDLGTQRVERRQ